MRDNGDIEGANETMDRLRPGEFKDELRQQLRLRRTPSVEIAEPGLPALPELPAIVEPYMPEPEPMQQ